MEEKGQCGHACYALRYTDMPRQSNGKRLYLKPCAVILHYHLVILFADPWIRDPDGKNSDPGSGVRDPQ
jgi:hypothetical protein